MKRIVALLCFIVSGCCLGVGISCMSRAICSVLFGETVLSFIASLLLVIALFFLPFIALWLENEV